ncbi:MAG: polysaccharide biosynthesis/export family protein [Deltaproteobacteria bacterium]|nr:polysaccharide biosynthesis/export family protein [Deltaproteobacteria bacterium]
MATAVELYSSGMRSVLLTLLVLTVGLGCADKATSPYPVSLRPGTTDASLGQGDLFEVRVFDEPDLAGVYQVGTDGAISFPLIGRVVVEGKLPSDVEQEIKARLADGFLKNPQVSVLVKEYRSKKVSVFGQVRNPGTFPFTEHMSVIEAITRAGGFTSMAKKNSVRVTRLVDGKTTKTTVAVEDIGQGKAPNYQLWPGDVVFVPERVF